MADYHQPTVSGRGILTYIANEVRKSQGNTLLSDDESVLRWFNENPLSGEQAIEIMIAAAYGLALRRASRIKMISTKPEFKALPATEPSLGEAMPQPPTHTQLDLGRLQANSETMAQPTQIQVDLETDIESFSTITTLERKLRELVRTEYQYFTEHRRSARMRDVLGEKTHGECLQRMEKSRSLSRGLAVDFLDFLYIGELETLIFGEWEIFRQVFHDKAWLKERVKMIIQVRNVVFHSRKVSRYLEHLTLGYCGEIAEKVEEWTRSMELPPSP